MSGPLTIVFMGTPDFAVPSLQALLAGPDRVAAVVCQPDRARGRGRKVSPPPVKVVAEQAGLPVLQPDSVRTPDFIKTLRAYAPDLLVVVAYGRILPEPLLRLAPLGAILRLMSATTRAPALMKGLRGTPCSRSSWTMELNGVPEGSRPTRRQSVSPTLPSACVRANTFETLWIEKGSSLSPEAWISPSAVTTQSPN